MSVTLNNSTPSLDKLDDVMKMVKMNEEKKKCNVKLITVLMDITVAVAKSVDSHFNKLFSKIEYTGSFYEGLRVWTPDEFDLDFVFKLPSYHIFLVEYKNPPLAVYKKVKFLSSEKHEFLDTRRYLSREKFRNWFIGVMDKTLGSVRPYLSNLGIIELSRKTSGPAVTWEINLQDGQSISVDLVPVFLVPNTKFPLKGLVDMEKTRDFKLKDWDWVLVPKPLKNLSNKDAKYAWRIHLLNAERKLLDQPQECFKPTIRLIKLLRDTQGWSSISSYFIKCLAFHLWFEKQHEGNYWKKKNMPNCIMDMLKMLERCLEQHHLSSFYFPNYNLFYPLNKATTRTIYCQLKKIMPKVVANPRAYFLPPNAQ